jgi:alanyl-tRNA synthetase
MSSQNDSASVRVRRQFLEYFRRQGHEIVRSSPLVPSDPTLLFTNAGMVQFKDVFTGQKQLGYKRASTSQKCVRAGGKHNDLDNVGRTARHHTFFEMLGNFSFGDYFKTDAIAFAWEFLVQELALDPQRMCVSVFAGDSGLGLGPDDEARELWKKVSGYGDDRIFGLGMKDNFWMMGDTGPQGPCSEIHYWLGDGKADLGRFGDEPAADGSGWVEIWNLVFMQFERPHKDAPLRPLPRPSIDTGAGLERVTAVAIGQRSNYDTDLFIPLLETVAHACGKPYRRTDSEDDVGMRVLADHSRATVNLIADGVLPSNLSRGYVLRSIMRRAIRFAVRLGLPAGFFATLCQQVIVLLGDIYPELRKASSLIEKAVNAEDEGFRSTIDRGLRLISDTELAAGPSDTKVLPGKVAFQLHDTFGFPLDLTQVIGREQGFAVDEVGFAEEMRKQRERSKFAGSGDQAVSTAYHALRAAHGGTTFLGYGAGVTGEQGQGRILAIIAHGQSVDAAAAGDEVEILTDRTPLYGRSGGQVGDTGRIVKREAGDTDTDASACEAEVLDTWKPVPELIVAKARVTSGSLFVGEEVTIQVDSDRRQRIRRNHSATHLLHLALREVLGQHVTQKGSYVGPDKLTFDFSHFSPLTAAELKRVEQLVNAAIRRNAAAVTEECSYDDAQKRGAMALFGEKYGDRVRVLALGESVELCGGTHVTRTGDIGLLKITSETGIAKGIRRIEALTAEAAEDHLAAREAELAAAAETLRTGPLEVSDRVGKLLEELKSREREILQLQKKLASSSSAGLYSEEKDLGGLHVVARRVDVADAKALRELAESLIGDGKAQVVALGSADGDKVALVVAVAKAHTGKLQAGKLVAALASQVGGKGGGKPEVAQAGGSDPSKLDDTLRSLFPLVTAAL